MSSNTSLMQPIGSRGNLKQLLELNKESIAAVVPSYLTPERILKVVMLAAMDVPDLLMCTKESILKSIMVSAQQGIPIGPQSGYLVPFNRKIKGGDGMPDRWIKEAQFIPDYRGIIAQAKRCNTITKAEAILVYQDDFFEVDWGNTEKPITHKPNYRSDNRKPENVVAAYFRAKLPDGDYQYEVMTKSELDAIKKRSKAEASGPWQTDEAEMERKSVVKRGMKYIPSLDERVNLTIQHDNLLEAGNLDAVGMLTDLPGNTKDVPEGGSSQDSQQQTTGQTVTTQETKNKMDDVAEQVANLRQEQESRQPAPPPPAQPAPPPIQATTTVETPAVTQQTAPPPVTPPPAPPVTTEPQPPPTWAEQQTSQPAPPPPVQAAPEPPPQGMWRQEQHDNNQMVWCLNQELKGGRGKILKDVQFPAVLTRDSESEAWTNDQLTRAQAGLAKVNTALQKNFKLESTVKSWFGTDLDKMSSQAMECLIQVLENWK